MNWTYPILILSAGDAAFAGYQSYNWLGIPAFSLASCAMLLWTARGHLSEARVKAYGHEPTTLWIMAGITLIYLSLALLMSIGLTAIYLMASFIRGIA